MSAPATVAAARNRRSPPWLPWALCWTSLGLLVSALCLRIASPDGGDDAAFYVVIQAPGVSLIPLVGALVAARLPSNPYGWLWCALGLAYAVLSMSAGLRAAGAVPRWLTWHVTGASFPTVICLLVYVVLLFPTGRLPGPAWRWLGRAAVVLAATAVLVLPFAPASVALGEQGPWVVGGRAGDLLAVVGDRSIDALFVLVVGAALSVLARFRRAEPVERQQLKWFLLAAGVAAVTIVVELLGVPLSDPVWAVVDAVAFGLLPLSVGIAVLRYRLFEIDRIISRTVSYGLLTGVLLVLFVALVRLLGSMLEPLTGTSSLAVAASTLAVAAAFNPVRRRLQAVVDRRFDRARYDAARAVDAFAARLRDQIDVAEIDAGLRETVSSTIAPARMGLWLRDANVGRA